MTEERPGGAVEPHHAAPPGMPAWVKGLGLVLFVLATLIITLMILGVGGEHGPGRHG